MRYTCTIKWSKFDHGHDDDICPSYQELFPKHLQVLEFVLNLSPLLAFSGLSYSKVTQIWKHIRHSKGFITLKSSITKVSNSESEALNKSPLKSPPTIAQHDPPHVKDV